MTLPQQPPPASVFSVKQGQSGWFVYAIQVALNEVGAKLVSDGAFGPLTFNAVVSFQRAHGLFADGIPGPKTQTLLVFLLGESAEHSRTTLAAGLVRGVSQAEASGMMTAVNWSVSGGVDCGCVQKRVSGPPFVEADLRSAFDTYNQLVQVAGNWIQRRDSFLGMTYPWSSGDREKAGRCAALAHNWPAGASAIAKNGSVPNAGAKANWIPRDLSGVSLVRFPDGTLVDTQGEWAAFYAMGGPHGEGLVSQYVTEWK